MHALAALARYRVGSQQYASLPLSFPHPNPNPNPNPNPSPNPSTNPNTNPNPNPDPNLTLTRDVAASPRCRDCWYTQQVVRSINAYKCASYLWP